ncbi:TPA: hypothetical protein ACQ0AO_002057, partial [Streptococcus agalactiae]
LLSTILVISENQKSGGKTIPTDTLPVRTFCTPSAYVGINFILYRYQSNYLTSDCLIDTSPKNSKKA